MESLSLDWGEYGWHRFLVVVDQATIFMWASIFDSMSNDNTVKFLGTIFATFGRHKELPSDSRPAFREKYEVSMTSLGIDVQYVSAYHPSGNGLAEQDIGKLNLASKRTA